MFNVLTSSRTELYDDDVVDVTSLSALDVVEIKVMFNVLAFVVNRQFLTNFDSGSLLQMPN